MFFGQHSSLLHSIPGWTSLVSLLIGDKEAHLPPFFFSIFLPIHLYPLMLILSLPGGLVSEISATYIFRLGEGFQVINFAFHSIFIVGSYDTFCILSYSHPFSVTPLQGRCSSPYLIFEKWGLLKISVKCMCDY